MPGPVLIVDGNNLLVRCIKAMEYSGLRSGENWQTGPLTAFIGALGRFTRLYEPEAVVICWDHGPSEYRRYLYPEYKIARKETDEAGQERKETAFGMVKTFLKACRIQQVAVQGFEADDVVAAYWRALPGRAKVIVSGDKDFLQLVDEHTVQLRPDGKGAYAIWDIERVVETYGCRPEQLPKLMALTGDAVDGIPGVRGLGPKKALRGLVEAAWDFARVSALNDPEKMNAALLSHALVNLRDDEFLPEVPKLRPFEPLHSSMGGECLELVTFLRSLEMETILNRFYTDTLWR